MNTRVDAPRAPSRKTLRTKFSQMNFFYARIYSTRCVSRLVRRKTSAISRSQFDRRRFSFFLFFSLVLFIRAFQECFSLFPLAVYLSLSLCLFIHPSVSLPSLRYLACRKSRGNSRSRVHPRTVSRERLSSYSFSPPPSSARARSGSGVGNLRATDFAPRLPPRSYGSRRSLERTARIEISRLDTSTRYFGRAEGNFSFRDLSIASITLPSFPLSSLLGVFSRNFSCERPRPDEQISFAKNVEPS